MMKSEFIEQCNATKKEYKEPTQSQYEKIEIVYMFHPLIKDKKTIAELYCNCGMMLIEDMLPRSLKLQEIDTELHRAQAVVNEIAQRQKELSQ